MQLVDDQQQTGAAGFAHQVGRAVEEVLDRSDQSGRPTGGVLGARDLGRHLRQAHSHLYADLLDAAGSARFAQVASATQGSGDSVDDVGQEWLMPDA